MLVLDNNYLFALKHQNLFAALNVYLLVEHSYLFNVVQRQIWASKCPNNNEKKQCQGKGKGKETQD